MTLLRSDPCPFCGSVELIRTRDGDYEAWCNGEYAQDAFPYLSADQRERLISGTCGPCWDKEMAVAE